MTEQEARAQIGRAWADVEGEELDWMDWFPVVAAGTIVDVISAAAETIDEVAAMVELAARIHEALADGLALVRSDGGDGGWSLHDADDPDSSYLASGQSRWMGEGRNAVDDPAGRWSDPTPAEYAAAQVERLRLAVRAARFERDRA